MDTISVKVHKEKVNIDRAVFLDLLDLGHIKDYAAYIEAVATNEISLHDLKDLAFKADVPYPLFFAPHDVVRKQLDDKYKNLYAKISSKDEIKLSSRGKIQLSDIELVVKDLSRKQEFLKARILPGAKTNTFIGCVAKLVKENIHNEEIANAIRSCLGLDISYLRNLSKGKVLSYIANRAESNGVLVSFSSYNYMPQNLSKDIELSGICIKDKKFPFVFINTRDGDDNPKILESDGRQLFTLTAMLVCIAMNRFILSTKVNKRDEGMHTKVFAIAGALLIPKADLVNIKPSKIDELKTYAQHFKVTPSMLLTRLTGIKAIETPLANHFRKMLSEEIKKSQSKTKRPPLPINGYAKYNGERFSREVSRAYRANTISQEELQNVLFRKGKADHNLVTEYTNKYS